MRALRWVVVLALLAFWACATLRPRGESTFAKGELVFSHAKHAEQDLACPTCHQGIESADTLSGGRHRPAMKDCQPCHEEVADKAHCSFCHRELSRATQATSSSTDRHIFFSHKRHTSRTKDCLSCHAGAAVATTLEGITRPKMQGDCFSCHGHLEAYRKLQCKACHQSLAQYPIRFVSSFNHGGNFLKEHGRWAQSNSDVCASCHGQSYCADCHSQRAGVLPSVKFAEKVDKQFIHRGDWLSRHPVESKSAEASCLRCHSPKTCERCHTSRGVSAGGQGASGRRSPHPSDWLNPGSPNNHGDEARRHITQCASCHDQGSLSNCVRCHRSASRGGPGIRPHPPGWERGGRREDAVCLFCH